MGLVWIHFHTYYWNSISCLILAVGIASEGSPMIDADFVRIFYNKTSNQFDTEDAFLSKELNCDFVTGGLCADSKVIM